MLLTACTVGPDYVRPTALVSAAYKEMQGWKVAQPRDNIIRGAWWEVFADPQLNALEAQVDVSNQNIAVAEAQFQQARALVREARASYFPTVTVGLGVTRVRGVVSTTGDASQTNGRGTSRGTATVYSLPIDVSWELDVWGRIRRTVESNQASAQASAADLASSRLSLQAELAQDYIQLRSLDAQKQLLDATVMAFTKGLELTQNRYASGVASRADVVQAETQLKTTQAQAIDIGVERAQLEHAIAVLIGTSPSNLSIPASPLTAEPPPIPVGVPSELLERRPDIAAAERRVAAANAQIGVAEAAFFPSITLGTSGGLDSTNLSEWLTWPMRFWSVGATLSETVFDGGFRRAQTDEARAAYDATVASYRQTVLTGFQEVEDNLAALRILADGAQVQDEAVKAAQESVTVTTNQYKAGTVNYLNVVAVQATALTNEITAVNILGRRATASVLLIKALGGGWNTSALPSADDVTVQAKSTQNRP
jgi:NodT family efflux transporter outer membrane factor (OMF) lipoprotein